jgi:hypothetical protein
MSDHIWIYLLDFQIQDVIHFGNCYLEIDEINIQFI